MIKANRGKTLYSSSSWSSIMHFNNKIFEFIQITILIIILFFPYTSSLIHKLTIANDDRTLFKIETFGFIKGGVMDITISNFHLSSYGKTIDKNLMIDDTYSLYRHQRHQRRYLKMNSTIDKNFPNNSNNQQLINTKTTKSTIINNNNATTKSKPTDSASNEKYKIGFVMRKASSESAAQQDIESIIDQDLCILDEPANSILLSPLSTSTSFSSSSTSLLSPRSNDNRYITNQAKENNQKISRILDADDIIINLSNQSITPWKKTHFHYIIPFSHTAGLYSLMFVRCLPKGNHLQINFQLEAIFYNPPIGPMGHRDYLSAGDAPLPILYFFFFLFFLMILIFWCLLIFKCCNQNGVVHKIHYLMAILLILKCFTLLFESIRYHNISLHGVSAESWSILYYIFTSLKAILLFTVILLIGSGWSLIKGYLNEKEKKIIAIVLILQVCNNIAYIVLEESSPGSQGWLTWRDILHIIDIICCCAVLFPIIWSIRHLRQAADIDGKAHINLQKLQLFRSFYIMVVVYIYFTRIIVLLLSATVPFHLIWLGDFFTELATLLFYSITGYQFRPAVHNPYLPVSTEESAIHSASGTGAGGSSGDRMNLNEYGLEGEEDDIEHYTGATSSTSGSSSNSNSKNSTSNNSSSFHVMKNITKH